MIAYNICAEQAQEIKSLHNNTVLISINEEEPANLYPLQLDRSDKRILTLRFSDVANRTERERGGKTETYLPINTDQAALLLKFMEENKTQDFVVHCAAGVSRSAAICLYLHHTYGHELKKRFWETSHPDKFVLGSLLFARYEQPKDRCTLSSLF